MSQRQKYRAKVRFGRRKQNEVVVKGKDEREAAAVAWKVGEATRPERAVKTVSVEVIEKAGT